MGRGARSGFDRELLSVLGDEYTQQILLATSGSQLPAAKLKQICDASLPTVYRRIERLLEHDLLIERTRIDPKGNHYSVYESDVERIDVTISDGEFEVELTRSQQAADRFTSMWDDIRGGGD
ncbi:transcriptional regulator (plasmid) [Haloferacaceae archaeon DSL9]